ncbi:MAG TPA: YheC/YheD family protein [Bacillales bacterium]|nr:YheC/YheD family protein [Bacillales bacterium]
MNDFGIVVLNENQELSYYNTIGKIAASYEFTVRKFIPSHIDPYTEHISGKTFDADSERWRTDTFKVPDVLYDRCFYSSRHSFKTNAPIVDWLKNKTLFLGFGLPNKWKVHKALQQDDYLKNYLIDTVHATEADTILEHLNKRGRILFKPESGSQGKGIFVAESEGGGITVRSDRRGKTVHKTFPARSLFRKWLFSQLTRSAFLVQPFLKFQNQDGQPFDVRIVVQKNEHGLWREEGRGVRTGKKGCLVSNLHSSGKLSSFGEWLETMPGHQRPFVKEEIDSIVEYLPHRLESVFGPLFELGIDIGVGSDGGVWILEANSKPGHRTLLEGGKTSLETLAETPLAYARHLLKQKELTEHDTTRETAKSQ